MFGVTAALLKCLLKNCANGGSQGGVVDRRAAICGANAAGGGL
jgi:hypothetical protein